jgi:hypothetical protein
VHALAVVALALLPACGPASRDEVRGYDYGAEAVDCHDDACRMVEANLADLRAQTVSYWQAVNKLMRLGERGVPTLLRELDTESAIHVQISAYVLTALGHGAEVAAWCRGLGRDRDGRDLACTPD